MARSAPQLLILMCSLWLAGCAGDEGAWQAASQADSPDQYAHYLRRFPSGVHAGDARQRLSRHLRVLHAEAFDALSAKDDRKKLALSIYDRILNLDGDNALALNNKAYALVSTTHEKPGDEAAIEEASMLLARALPHANHQRIALNQLAFVMAGGTLGPTAGQFRSAADLGTASRSGSLRGTIIANLRIVHRGLIRPAPRPDDLGPLSIRGRVSREKEENAGGVELWMVEGDVESGTGDGTSKVKLSYSYDQRGALMNPSAVTDAEGNFEFSIDADAQVDLVVDRRILLVAGASSNPTKALLFRTGRVFVLEIDGRETRVSLGQLELR